MGYTVYYQVRIGWPGGGDLDGETHRRVLDHIAADEDLFFEFGEDGSGDPAGPSKYPGPEEGMVGLSRRFPEVLFALYAEGEESPDFRVIYYLGGEWYEASATVVYPPFEAAALPPGWGDTLLFCGECGEADSFVRYDHTVVHKQTVDARGLARWDLGYVEDGEPAPEVRCATCEAPVEGR